MLTLEPKNPNFPSQSYCPGGGGGESVMQEQAHGSSASLWLQGLLAFGYEIPLCVPFTSGHHFVSVLHWGLWTLFFLTAMKSHEKPTSLQQHILLEEFPP